jgi:GH18 family chitinase
MISFTSSTLPKIKKSVDFLNIMTYDLMNRRDNVTKHHSGANASEDAVLRYHRRGFRMWHTNIGLGFYIKWFKTAADDTCDRVPAIGCRTELMEDPVTGADLGKAGAFSWHDEVPQELAGSFYRAMENGVDDINGVRFEGHYYMDKKERIFWSWDTPDSIRKKMNSILHDNGGIGGLFAWGLGEDAPRFEHLKAVNEVLEDIERGPKWVGHWPGDRTSEHQEL